MAGIVPPTPSARSREPERERLVGEYMIGDQIGQGSFANVYKGRHANKVRSLSRLLISLWLSGSLSIVRAGLTRAFVTAWFLRGYQVRDPAETHGQAQSRPFR